MNPVVLYLSVVEGSPSQVAKLAGIRRYCAARGWAAEPVFQRGLTAASLPSILRERRPVGCVVDGVGRNCWLPPHRFGGLPLAYIGYPRDTTAGHANFNFDAAAIARAAFRELSAGRPSGYAAVGYPHPQDWSVSRVRAFRAEARAAGARCRAFPVRPARADESREDFAARLVPWLAALPEHCAVFAVSDQVAEMVAAAARAARRAIPRSLTLLSVDNFADICERAVPPISSVQLDFERVGWLAAKAMGEEIPRRGAEKEKGWRRDGRETTDARREEMDARRKTSRDSPAPATPVASRVSRLASSPLCASAPLRENKLETVGPLLVVRRRSTAGRGRRKDFVLEAVETIRREATSGLAPAALMRRFPVSRRLFTMRFREAVGHSVLDEITHVRLEKAMTLLSRTDTPVGAVPGLCGFACDRTLDAIFRARFGMGMRAWRKANSR